MDVVSIITTFYNSQDYILKCLDSINKQVTDEFFKIEYILIDDCSTDDSVKIVKLFFENYLNKESNIEYKLISTPNNLGCGGARNFGIKNSSGKFLMFLDADDYYIHNDFVKRAYWNIIEQTKEENEYNEKAIHYINGSRHDFDRRLQPS